MPMCQHEDMALAPWGALGGGYFKVEIRIPFGGFAVAN